MSKNLAERLREFDRSINFRRGDVPFQPFAEELPGSQDRELLGRYTKNHSFLRTIEPVEAFLAATQDNKGQANINSALINYYLKSLAHFCLTETASPEEGFIDSTETYGIYQVLGNELFFPITRADSLLFTESEGKTYLTGAYIFVAEGLHLPVSETRMAQMDYFSNHTLKRDLFALEDPLWLENFGRMIHKRHPNLSGNLIYDPEEFTAFFCVTSNHYKSSLEFLESDQFDIEELPFNFVTVRLLAKFLKETLGPKKAVNKSI